MGTSIKLQDPVTKEDLYPLTSVDNIYSSDNTPLGAILNNKADKTGSNIDKVEFNKNLQNDWVNKFLRPLSKLSNTSWLTIDLYNYLDNTDGLFEVLVSFYVYNNGSANKGVNVYTDCIGDSTNSISVTYDWKYDNSANTFYLPVKRYVYVKTNLASSGDEDTMRLFGYRRIK